MDKGESTLLKVLHAKKSDEFRMKIEKKDKYGITHRRFQQYYKGIKVENAEYLIHGKNGLIQTMNGDFRDVNISSVQPAIGEKQALNSALNFVDAKKYKWQDADMEIFIKKRTNNPKATYYPKGELVIVNDTLKNKENLRLAWKFTISSLVPNNEQWVYVNAETNDIIRTTPLIFDINTPATAQTLYSGTLGIISDSYSGGFRLNETRTTTSGNDINIHTFNSLSQPNYTNAAEFSNNNTNWTTGSWSDINQDQSALDAHWGEEMVIDYWSTVHTRNSLDDHGLSVSGYVHYFEANSSAGWPNNAQWDNVAHTMRYGDGDGITFNPLTSLDIIAHEMGHGITAFTSSLTPGNQESGALNEGFSDIWAASIEHWAASGDPNKNTWLIGEEIVGSAFTSVRNLQNPKSTTTAEGQHPDTYQGQYWATNGEPHTNSTVLSHWFYLLSQGGSGTNDNNDSYLVDGIGIDHAQLIAYQAESNYLDPSADYADARITTIRSAEDIYGSNSCEVISTINAWYAVGVGQAYIINSFISGPDAFCSSAVYSLNNPPASASINWTITPSGVASLISSGNSVTVNKTGGGDATLKATIDGCASVSAFTKSISTVAKVVSVTSEYNGCYNGYAAWRVTATPNFTGASNWHWTVDNPSSGSWYIDQPNSSSTWVEVKGGGGITVTYQSPCGGTSQTNGTTIYSSCGSTFSATMYPNPTTENTLNIEIPKSQIVYSLTNSSSTRNHGLEHIEEVEIFDIYNHLLTNQIFKTNPSQVKMNVSNLKEGIYLVKVSDGIHRETQRLI
jgi:Zn-dependent metalloprotease